MAELEPPASTSAPPPRLQFSLRSQMIVVTILAVLLGLFVIAGQAVVWGLYHLLVYCLLPTPLVVGALWGRGDVRTFSTGALVPWVATWANSSPLPLLLYQRNSSVGESIGWLIAFTIFTLIATAGCGVLAVFTRRWLDRRNSLSPRDD